MIAPRAGKGLARISSTSDQDQRNQFGQSGGRQPVELRCQILRFGLKHSDRQAGEYGYHHKIEAGQDGCGQGRDDEQGVGNRHQRDDGRDEDARQAGNSGTEHPVVGRDPVG